MSAGAFAVRAAVACLTACVPSASDTATRVELGDGVTGVRAGDSWAYVWSSDDRAALVDAGSDPTGKALLTELARRGAGADRVEAILLTDAHRDHVAAAALFPHATVYASAACHATLRGELPVAGLWPRIAAAFAEPHPLHQHLRTVLPGAWVQAAGRSVEVIAAPGHTPGSVAYQLGGVLFTGDALLVDGETLALPHWACSDDLDAARASADRLLALPFTILADGHGGFAPHRRSP